MTPRPTRRAGHIRYRNTSRSRRVFLTRLRMVICLSLTGFLLIGLENTLLSALPLPGIGYLLAPGKNPPGGWVYAAPAFGLLFAMGVGFLLGEEEGAIAGLLTGWFCEVVTSPVEPLEAAILLPILYALCGGLSGLFCKRGLGQNWPSFLVFSLVGGGVNVLFELTRTALAVGQFLPLASMPLAIIPRWLITALLSPLVYGAVRLCTLARNEHRANLANL